MAKTKTAFPNYTLSSAIALHATAFKSDPFASRRIASHLALFPKDIQKAGEDAQRVIEARGYHDRKIGNVFAVPALYALKDALRAIVRKPVRKPRKLGMSAYLNKRDMQVAA